MVYLADLVAEALDANAEVKASFISQFLRSQHLQRNLDRSSDRLSQFIFRHQRNGRKDHGGNQKSEVPNFIRRTLSDYIRDYPFITDPMPNLYFTRDPFCVVGHGIMLNKMYTLTRAGDDLRRIHFQIPSRLREPSRNHFFRDFPSTIEGGRHRPERKIIAVGVSERTHPASIEKLAKNLFYKYETSFEKVLAMDIPKTRSFMHLDTVFTQVDHDKFTTHAELKETMRVFELTRDPEREGKLLVKPIEKSLKEILEFYLERESTHPLRWRGHRRRQPRAMERRRQVPSDRARRSHRLSAKPHHERFACKTWGQNPCDSFKRIIPRPGRAPLHEHALLPRRHMKTEDHK